MRLASFALLALTGTEAFTPTPLPRTTTSLYAQNENSFDLPKVVLSTITAATLFTGSFAPLEAIAASAPTVDPLSKEKSLVLSTKTTLNSAQSAIPTLEASLKEAQAAVTKDEAAVKAAEKKVKETKKLLMNVNDKLAEARGRGLPEGDKLVGVLSKDSGELCR